MGEMKISGLTIHLVDPCSKKVIYSPHFSTLSAPIIMSFEVIVTQEAARTRRNPAGMRFSSQVARQMMLKTFEVSKATFTPHNAGMLLRL
jgi:hypothetical protein